MDIFLKKLPEKDRGREGKWAIILKRKTQKTIYRILTKTVAYQWHLDG